MLIDFFVRNQNDWTLEMLAFWVPRVQSHNMKTMLVEEILHQFKW